MKIFRCVGGIGNQMFIYAAARVTQLRFPEDKVILVYDEQSYEVRKEVYKYDLSSLHISRDILVEDETFENAISKCGIERLTASIARKVVARLLNKSEFFESAVLTVCQPIFNFFGSYCVGWKAQKAKKYITKDLICEGYFQSADYFNDYKAVIQRELKVRLPFPEEKKHILDEIRSVNSVCVHVRKGDYNKLTQFQVCTQQYYNRAIKKILELVENPTFFVFSDDINWCIKNIEWKENTIFVSEPVCYNESDFNNPFIDLQMMYECKHFVISNSSYSWWAQYLSEYDGKIVIAPSKWMANKVVQDIYQDNWIKIEG